jgi:predicted DsbA family dithiol-disulfide isomerase
MLIEVFADFSCPWCFIGRRRLTRALALRPHLPLQIVWQPFQLNPELPACGVDRRHRNSHHTLDVDRLAAMERALVASGAKDGIAFAFDRILRIPNTMGAHRLMRFAARWGKEDALVDQLFGAYFERGQDIGSVDVLTRCAADAELSARDARAFLLSGEEAASVATTDALAHQGGINGVPYFVFARRYALAGAQEPAAFLPLLDALCVTADDMLASRA